MITSRQLTAGGVTALIIPFAIATGGWGVVPIAILSSLALVYAPTSTPRTTSPNTENAKAAAALAETADFEHQSRGVEENYDIPYRPAYEEMKKVNHLDACRKAYDNGITVVDDVLQYVRQTTGDKVAHSKKNREWVKFNYFQWDNGVDDTVQL
jgi:hypothetical protein